MDAILGRFSSSAIALHQRLRRKIEGMWLESPYYWLTLLSGMEKNHAGRELLRQSVQTELGKTLDAPVPVQQLGACFLYKDWTAGFKLGMLNPENSYMFSNITAGRYPAFLFLGISPDQVHLWVVPSAHPHLYLQEVKPHLRPPTSKRTYFIEVEIQRIPEWIKPYGGTLEQGLSVLDYILESAPDTTP